MLRVALSITTLISFLTFSASAQDQDVYKSMALRIMRFVSHLTLFRLNFVKNILRSLLLKVSDVVTKPGLKLSLSKLYLCLYNVSVRRPGNLQN